MILNSLKEEKLSSVVKNYLDIELAIFFKDYYKTFNPKIAAELGKMYIFDDVKKFLEKFNEDKKYVASNSTLEASEIN